MSGKLIKSGQVKIYMTERTEGETQETSAAKAGISERSGRRIEKDGLQPGRKPRRGWRTRKDPFAAVWHEDYRHVIASLERKPQAFRYSQIRDDLLPGTVYKSVWRWLDLEMVPRKACKTMVGILALAAKSDCEERLGEYLQAMMSRQKLPVLLDLERIFSPNTSGSPEIAVHQPAVQGYDVLLPTMQGCTDGA